MNFNQTGVILLLGGTNNKYEVKKAKQVFIHEKKKKHLLMFYEWILKLNFNPHKVFERERVLTTKLPTNKASKEAIKKRHYFELNKLIY